MDQFHDEIEDEDDPVLDVVSMSGPRYGHDMRRLDQLRGPALEQQQIPLTLNLRAATSIDGAARAATPILIRAN